MTSLTFSELVAEKLATLYYNPTLSRFGEQEAQRIIHDLGLVHPMTLPAAVKVVCEEGYVESHEVEAVALMLFMALSRGRDRKAA